MKSTHFNDKGDAHMVDVSDKDITVRQAIASGSISMNKKTFDMINNKEVKKGDVLQVARLAGIMAAKKTGELIPLCHPLSLSSIEIEFKPIKSKKEIVAKATILARDRTGVEMEAITAVSIALATIYDMCKSVDRGMVIKEIKLLRKSGGKSGLWERKK